jgi:hypothetical protein
MQGGFFFLILIAFVLTANWQTIILLQKSFVHPFNSTCHISYDVWYRNRELKPAVYGSNFDFLGHPMKTGAPATSETMENIPAHRRCSEYPAKKNLLNWQYSFAILIPNKIILI